MTTEQVLQIPPELTGEEAQRTADAVNRYAAPPAVYPAYPNHPPSYLAKPNGSPRRWRPRTQVELDQERFRAGLAERLAGGEDVPAGLFM